MPNKDYVGSRQLVDKRAISLNLAFRFVWRCACLLSFTYKNDNLRRRFRPGICKPITAEPYAFLDTIRTRQLKRIQLYSSGLLDSVGRAAGFGLVCPNHAVGAGRCGLLNIAGIGHGGLLDYSGRWIWWAAGYGGLLDYSGLLAIVGAGHGGLYGVLVAAKEMYRHPGHFAPCDALCGRWGVAVDAKLTYLVESGIWVCMALRMSTRFCIQKRRPPTSFPAGDLQTHNSRAPCVPIYYKEHTKSSNTLGGQLGWINDW